MATDPAYYSTPKVQGATIAASGAAYGGTRAAPTGLTTIFTGDTVKNRVVYRVDVKALGISVASLVEFWLYNGTNHFLISGVRTPVLARTPSTTLDTWDAVWKPEDYIFLPAAATAWELRAGCSVAQNASGGMSFVTHGAEA